VGVFEGTVGTRPAARRARLLTLVAQEPYLVALVGVYAFALARLAPFEFAGDSWLTLAGGREVWQHGLPAHETLTVMAHGARWIDQQWLAQLAFYGLYALGGLKVVALGHVAALVGGLALALFAARSLGASPRAAFWVGVGSLFLAPWSLQLRAQSLAYVPFVAVLWLLARDARAPSRKVYLVLPVLALWANLHGTVVLGALLVVEGERLVGVFSERDYARKVILKGKASKEIPVREIMTSHILYVRPEQTIEDCMALMTDKRVRHLPVLEEERLVGVISIGDVVKAIIAEQDFMIEQLQNYITGR